MSKKTILYLRTDITEQELVVGGSVSHTIGVINGFVKLGYAVVCASSCMEKVLYALPLVELKVLRISWLYSIARWKLTSLFSTILFLPNVFILSSRYSCDFIYQRYSMLNATGLLLSKLKKIPFVLEFNGSELWVDTYWSKSRLFKLTRLIAWIEKINLHHAQVIVVVSQVLKDDLVARGIEAQKILVNPNGVDAEFYDPLKLVYERAELRRRLRLEDRFVFGFIGTFSQWHGIELLAEMIPAVVAKNGRAHFLLIGDGPLKSFLKQALRDVPAVTFVDTVPAYQARNYLAVCDAFLCPTQPNPDGSRFFGSPTKMFEYMSMGKPIIASDLGQMSDLLHPAVRCEGDFFSEGTGFLALPESKDFAHKAAQLMTLSEQRRFYIGMEARKKVIEQYTWTNHVQKIVQKIA